MARGYERRGRSGPGGPNPVDIHVGARVRLRRTLLGLSQEKLGEAIGLTFQQVQKYERGATRIGSSRLFDLSRVLDVPVGFFFEDMPSTVASRSPAQIRGNEFAMQGGAEERAHAFIRLTNRRNSPSVRTPWRSVEVEVNSANDLAWESIYPIVTGTSAEAGDDGEAGRGIRIDGLIAPYRPMTMESVAGRNPVTHVGKLYNIIASRFDAELRAGAEVVDDK